MDTLGNLTLGKIAMAFKICHVISGDIAIIALQFSDELMNQIIKIEGNSLWLIKHYPYVIQLTNPKFCAKSWYNTLPLNS